MPHQRFCDLPKDYSAFDTASVVILPVPYDGTSTWMKGADKGPDAIISASGYVELYDIETDREPYKVGIFTDTPVSEHSSPESMVEAVTQRVRRHLDAGKFVVTIGGEHSISAGTAAAHHERYRGITVLQLDAHTDLRDEYHGSKFNHACVMSRIKEHSPIVQVGIRSMDVSEKASLDPERTFFAHRIAGSITWIGDVIAKLSEQVYLTIDLDVFDPSIMPSTGTPEPGGLSWYEVMALLREVASKRRVVGFDVMELCPGEVNRHSDFLAAKMIYKLIGYIFSTRAS